VAEFFELFFVEEVVRDLEHRAFFFVNMMLDEILERQRANSGRSSV